MEIKPDDQWVRRAATWLPRLADAGSRSEAGEALLAIRMQMLEEDIANQTLRPPNDPLDDIRLFYKSAIEYLGSEVDTLLPRWIEQLIASIQKTHSETEARVAAIKTGEESPDFDLADIMAAVELGSAIQAAGERIDPQVDRIVAAFGSAGRDGDDTLPDLLRFAGPAITRATPALFGLLRQYGIWSSRSGVREALKRAAEFDPTIVPALQQMLHADGAEHRRSAAAVLGAIGSTDPSVTDDLLTMEAGDIDERCTAIYALAQHHPPSDGTLDLLERAIGDPNGYVRRAAAYAMGELRADASRFVPTLIAACDDAEILHDQSLPESAVVALGKYGQDAAAAIPRLRRFLEGPIAERSVDPPDVERAIKAITITGISIDSPEPKVRNNALAPEEPLFSVQYKGKHCYIDATGRIALATDFDYGEPFRDNRAIVSSDRRTAVIDRIGQIVFESTWKSIKPFHEGLAAVRKDDRWGFVDADGRVVIEPTYDSVTRFSQGLAGVEIGRGELSLGGSLTMARPGKRGFIDRTGKVVIPIQYEDVEPFSEGRAVVCLSSTLKPNPIADGQLLPSDRKYGLLDLVGNVVVGGQYSLIFSFSEGMAAVCVGEPFGRGRYGYIDPSGRVVIPLRFTSAGSFNAGAAVVTCRGHHRRRISILIDRTGRVVLETALQLNWERFSEGLAAATTGNLWGVIDTTGRFVIEPQFDDIGPFTNGVAVVTRGKWGGLIDRSGKFIWGPTTESVYGSRSLESEWT